MDTLLPHFVQEKIIDPNNQQEIDVIAKQDEKVKKLMTYISGPLEAGNTKVFYAMLRIMEENGNQTTQNLVGEIRKSLSM